VAVLRGAFWALAPKSYIASPKNGVLWGLIHIAMTQCSSDSISFVVRFVRVLELNSHFALVWDSGSSILNEKSVKMVSLVVERAKMPLHAPPIYLTSAHRSVPAHGPRAPLPLVRGVLPPPPKAMTHTPPPPNSRSFHVPALPFPLFSCPSFPIPSFPSPPPPFLFPVLPSPPLPSPALSWGYGGIAPGKFLLFHRCS
jgi:hypothetical protein